MKKTSKKTTKIQHSMLNNLLYILKIQCAEYPNIRWLLPLRIITEIILPVIATVLPAVAVNLIVEEKDISKFIISMFSMVILYGVCNCIHEVSAQWVNESNSWVRFINFGKKLIHKTITMDYSNVEPQEMQRLIEKGSNALGGSAVGIELMLKQFTAVIVNFVGMLGYATVIVCLDYKILIILIVMSVAKILLNKYARDYMKKLQDENTGVVRKINYLYEVLSGPESGKDLRLYEMSRLFIPAFKCACKDGARIQEKVEKKWSLPEIVDIFFIALRDWYAYFILIRQSLYGIIKLSTFSLYIGIVSGFSNWLYGFVTAYSEMQKGSIHVDDYRCILEYPEQFCRNSGIALSDVEGKQLEIEFRHVSFRYKGANKDTIHDINLKIKEGEKIALVGNNGAGKTTLVKLMCGFYLPTSGEILVKGRSIKEYNLTEYFKLLSIVFQDVELMAFTIAENVSCKKIGDTDIDKVMQCLKSVGLYDKVMSLKHKEKTYITQRLNDEGILLSGGETQKLMLARAIYKNSPIMILDEPTAALDPLAESKMYMQYSQLVNNRVSIFISHRLASTKFCDKIIYMENGMILEQGNHEELLKLGKKYANVFEVQSHYYKEVLE